MKLTLKNPGLYFWLSVVFCIVYFVLFISPNRVGSRNMAMLAVFEPDESVPLPYVFEMIKPAETVKDALINFAFYEYYFYGFPFFAVSALSVLPLVPLGLIDDISLVMVILRQVLSVLPMLAAVLLMAHIQPGFKSYKSLVLVVLSLSIPAVVRNNFWWHPDSLATLLTVLTIYVLYKDDLKFGRGFYIAALLCGFSAGTKGIGFYFFLAIGVYLLLGFFLKKLPLGKLFLMGLGFILCMGAGYLLANPILVYRGVRNDYFALMERQSVELYSGYWVLYPKGFFVSLGPLQEYFGHILFLALAVFACLTGIVKDRNRLLNILILTWAIPMSVMAFWISNFKFQYWIPVAVPLFSSMMDFLPDGVSRPREFSMQKVVRSLPQIVFSLAIVLQVVSYIDSDIDRYLAYLNREKDKPALVFHDLAKDALKPVLDDKIFAYNDVRMYFPTPEGWRMEAVFQPLDYDYITSRDFDVLLIMQQRVYDYIDPGTQGIDPEEFAQSRIFYHDANDGKIEGYRLVFRDYFGLVFVKEEVFEQNFEN
jgi:hypothetical protein